MTHQQKALNTAVWAGEILLQNGAEISRVQGTIIRFLESFGIQDYHVYVLSNGIFATVGEQGETPCHAVRTVNAGTPHLGRVAAVNELSREVAAPGARLGMDEIRRRLQGCEDLSGPPLWLLVLSCAVGSAGFGYIMGGSPLDALAAFFCGLGLGAYLTHAQKNGLNRFITSLLGGAGVTLAARLLLLLHVGGSLDKAIIGAIIPMVPGVLLTTSIRDFFNSDYVSGAIHLIESLLTAACLAVGVGGMLRLLSYLEGVAP